MKPNLLKAKINTKTLNLVLLSIVTAQVFKIMWLFKSNSVIEEVLEDKILDNRIIVLAAVFVGLGLLTSGVTYIFAGVFYIVWAFKAKKALQKMMLNDHKIDYEMNSFYTFLFDVYYINFCINEIENVLSEKATVEN